MINLHDLDQHPLAARFYDLGVELEKLPPSPEQTYLIVMLGHLLFSTQDLLNGTGRSEQMIDLSDPYTNRAWEMFLDMQASL